MAVGGGACMVGACVARGGMCDGGNAWQGGACVIRGMHGKGGIRDMQAPPPGRHYGHGIRSMSGRYAS